MLPIRVPENFRIIAHRGASAYAPENTEPAFALAAQMGVAEVELDTQLTTDGEVVLCHDATLARYGHGEVVVETMRWEELARLDMGSWFSPYLFRNTRMERLDDLFARYGDRFIYHVELKGKAAGLPAAVLRLIRSHGLMDSCIVTSFSYDSLQAMRELDGNIRLGWLIQRIDADTIARGQTLSLFQLCPFAGNATEATTKQARSIFPEVRAWGLLGASAGRQSQEVIALIHQVLAAQCDGMTINWPDWVSHD